MDHERAGAAGKRRGDRRVLQLHGRVVDRRPVGGQCAFERSDRRARGVDLLPGRDPAVGKVLIALRLRLGVGGLGGVALQVRARLLERRFERTAIEREEQLALPDVVAFLEFHRCELAGQLRAHRDG